MRGRRAYRQAGLIMAPSITTPALTYFQSATSSFRANATIVVLRRRLPLHSVRSLNQRVSAERGYGERKWSGSFRYWTRVAVQEVKSFATRTCMIGALPLEASRWTTW
jgi:hypothetical protein